MISIPSAAPTCGLRIQSPLLPRLSWQGPSPEHSHTAQQWGSICSNDPEVLGEQPSVPHCCLTSLGELGQAPGHGWLQAILSPVSPGSPATMRVLFAQVWV